ncbi:MarR family transcriptional regulator [Streptococcus sobrinus]|mgnify:FL=1|uniref:Transcriptional regulator, MarR family n=1 Tax=Streptococcus sobrinus W1703 TaxID=1227275 RepID=U2KSE7_9STRE|nr:MarR family transcriptional regulator [Streptococcus sobrinus]ERJ77783.1 transcriptional regulator, MarR family [Streptococcus sobrinus W1703]
MVDQLLDFSQKLQSFLASYQKLEQEQHRIPNHNLTVAEVHLLVALSKNNRMNLSQLAQKEQVSRSAVTQLVNKLVKKGYLKKEISQLKKSSYHLHLTQSGQEVIGWHQKQHDFLATQLEGVLQAYSKNFLTNLAHLMTDVEAVLEELARKKYPGVVR